MPNQFTPEVITAAIEGFEAQKGRIDDQISELRAMLSGGSAHITATPEAPGRKRREFSAAARQRMREAQQRRWAKVRGKSEQPTTPEPEKPKRRTSEEGMKRIIAATKKRWALKRAEAAKAKKAAPAPKEAAVKRARVKDKPLMVAKRTPVKKAAAGKKAATALAPAKTEAAAQ